MAQRPYNRPPQTIVLEVPKKRHGLPGARRDDHSIIVLDEQQRKHIRRHSKKFGHFLKVDRDSNRWESRFIDFDRKVSPSTTRALVQMLATHDGHWPDDFPRKGAQLVKLYIAFEVFECDYNVLCNSDGFEQAARHLIFSQPLQEVVEENFRATNDIQALISTIEDRREYICLRFRFEFDQASRGLHRRSQECAERLRVEMQRQGFRKVLDRISNDHESATFPLPEVLNGVFEIIDELLEAPVVSFSKTTKTMGARGSRGVAGAVSKVFEKITIAQAPGSPTPVASTTVVGDGNQLLRDFEENFDDMVNEISRNAVAKFRAEICEQRADSGIEEIVEEVEPTWEGDPPCVIYGNVYAA